MTYIAASLAAAFLVVAFQKLQVLTVAAQAIKTSRDALDCLRSSSLTDSDKERMLQKASLSLMLGFFSIILRGVGAVAFSALPVLGFGAAGLVEVSAVTGLLMTWQGIMLTSAVMLLMYLSIHQGRSDRQDKKSKPESNYSALDRAFHGLAFGNPALQLTAADIEEALYGGRFNHVKIQKPVFITSLPRAGTTLMLDSLTKIAPLAAHCYRDMPFVLAPVLWDKWSKRFRKPADLMERAHQDGMMVGYDSPEAFEEILWRAFWPKKFVGNRIALWSSNEEGEEFAEFFRRHIKKIIWLRSQADQRRYVSKNNANIARIDFLKHLFPDGYIVVPFRNPLSQARSLLSQHNRFLIRHKEDPFSKRYMNDIGHLEFGELLQPIAFEGMDEVVTRYRPESLEYWIGYWIQAFAHIIRQKDKVLFVSYETLCKKGITGLREIAGRISLEPHELRNSAAASFHEPREHTAGSGGVDAQLLARAESLHRQLLDSSIV